MSELQLFKIDSCIGGNQDWFTDYWMNRGGCGAVTACDMCLYFALFFGEAKLYPFSLDKLSKDDYIEFSSIMKPYLSPRIHGINRLEIFIDGFNKYLAGRGEKNLKMSGLYADCSFEKYRKAIKNQLDKKMPVPYLNLRHKNPQLRDYVWHWFWLAGYQEFRHAFMVKIITYGRPHWVSLNQLWDSGYKKNGGIILLELQK